MLTFDLRGMIDEYEARTGVRISYPSVASLAEVSPDTVKSLATRPDYNATLHVIAKIALALGTNPIKYLRWNPDQLRDEG